LKFKNVITKAIGIGETVNPDIQTLPLNKGDIFLLCTDGLTDCVKDPDIEETLKQTSSIKEAALQLVEKAKNGGGNDNITIVIIKVS
jgi:protein phosphatase